MYSLVESLLRLNVHGGVFRQAGTKVSAKLAASAAEPGSRSLIQT